MLADPKGLPLVWRDRWWRMFDRDPIMSSVKGRIELLGDAAHPPPQYIAQGAIVAIEDGRVLAEHVARPTGHSPGIDWAALWHLDGDNREQRNAILRARDTYDYSFVDLIFGPTALTPDQEPDPSQTIPLDSVGP